MKPLIRRRFGIWTCRSWVDTDLIVGNGYSPVEAFREWERIRAEKATA